jgi:ribosomal protein L33
MALFNINQISREMESENSFELIPEGYHNFIVENAEVRGSKKGTGNFIELTCKIEGGNRKHWHYFNIQNTNEQVATRGLVDLKKFCLAINVQEIVEASVLIDSIFCAKIVHIKDTNNKMNAKMVEFKPYCNHSNDAAAANDVPF